MKNKTAKTLVCLLTIFGSGFQLCQASTIAWWRGGTSGGDLVNSASSGSYYNAALPSAGSSESVVAGSSIFDPATGISYANTESYKNGLGSPSVGALLDSSSSASLENIFKEDFTIEAIVQMDLVAGYSVIFAVGGVYFETGGASDIIFAGSGADLHGPVLVADQWYNLAIVGTKGAFDTVLNLYVDGTLIAQQAIVGGFVPNIPGDLGSIGAFNTDDSDHYWRGNIDELRISNVALAPEQFLQAVPEPGTIALLFGAGGLFALIRSRKSARA